MIKSKKISSRSARRLSERTHHTSGFKLQIKRQSLFASHWCIVCDTIDTNHTKYVICALKPNDDILYNKTNKLIPNSVVNNRKPVITQSMEGTWKKSRHNLNI